MFRSIRAFLALALVFLAMDFVWISQTGPILYRPALGPILIEGVRPIAAVAFYVIYLTGVFVLVVRPALGGGSAWRAALSGALFGLTAYAAYDLTNQATLKVWSTTVTLCDLGWGAFVTGVASGVAVLAAGGPGARTGRS